MEDYWYLFVLKMYWKFLVVIVLLLLMVLVILCFLDVVNVVFLKDDCVEVVFVILLGVNSFFG